MEQSIVRPSTPPPRTGLLTPPSTGGLSKPDSSAKSEEVCAQSKRHLQNFAQEREEVGDFFEVCDKYSYIRVDDSSDDDMLHLHDSLFASESQCATEPATRLTTATISKPKQEVTQKINDPEILPHDSTISVANRPFPFLKLALPVRTRIYTHLLTIPAVICVRQKHTAYHDERKAYLYAERRDLLPGIAYALAQTQVNGFKTRFSRFSHTNLAILRVNREIFTEARGVLYASNAFEIVKPTNELSPQPDFSIPLFPPGYQRLVTKLNIRVRTLYDLSWLLSGGYNVLRRYYRGLDSLTLILELDSATKGFGRLWSRRPCETWICYIRRLWGKMAEDLLDGAEATCRTIPVSIDLRVLFSGERYDGGPAGVGNGGSGQVKGDNSVERAKREELRAALVETWELFKKGGR